MTGIPPAIVRRLAGRARWAVFLLLMAAGWPLAAHPAYLTSAVATIQRDGRFEVRVRFDTLAFALNDTSDRMPDPPMNALLDGPRAELERRMTAARVHFMRHFQLEANGRPVAIAALHFPTTDDVLAWKAANHEPRLPVLLSAEVSGQLPPDTTRIAFSFPEIIGTIVLAVERPGEEAWTGPLEPGATSNELPVALSTTAGASALPVIAGSKWNWLETLGRFVVLGFEHIVPRGLDHVLFVLGLFLLGTRLSALLWQVTAFTVAHSVSLGLSLYGVVRLPPTVVEPLIAFSIVLVAVDNLRSAGLRWWRLPVVFAFGLVHGMGFAGALLDLGVSRHDFPPMLVGFNLGVELGQLAVIAAAFALVGWLRSRADYRRLVVIPGSVAIGCIALIWTIARMGTALRVF
jgi:hypothetical protein